jgi:hypothetical protein
MKFTLVQTDYTATMHGSQPFIISDRNHHHGSNNKLVDKKEDLPSKFLLHLQ